MIELAVFVGGCFLGFIIGYIICAIYLGEKIEELQNEIATYIDRDDRGRFKKSMRTLYYD